MIQAKVNNNFEYQIKTDLSSFANDDTPVIINNLANGSISVQIGSVTHEADLVDFDPISKTVTIKINQNKYVVKVQEPIDQLIKKLGINIATSTKVNTLKSPMPGLILKVFVTNGQAIKKGDALISLEAMKMENVYKALLDGMVDEVLVTEKQTVEKGTTLIKFK